jgi:hypothetical protein
MLPNNLLGLGERCLAGALGGGIDWESPAPLDDSTDDIRRDGIKLQLTSFVLPGFRKLREQVGDALAEARRCGFSVRGIELARHSKPLFPPECDAIHE